MAQPHQHGSECTRALRSAHAANDRLREERNAVRRALEAESEQLNIVRRALSDAAQEINCAGPVADRIRVMKAEHGKRLEELELRALRAELGVKRAQGLADEVGLLVERHVIDSRSPAADALLDFRDPNPPNPRRPLREELEAELTWRREMTGPSSWVCADGHQRIVCEAPPCPVCAAREAARPRPLLPPAVGELPALPITIGAGNHDCAARGCGKSIALALFMCTPHWRMVPPMLRTHLLGARVLGLPVGRERDGITFQATALEAIEHVAARTGR
jgi:hypothetical protein